MKKIAFLGEPWHGAMVRLSSFMSSNPQYEYSFVNANDQMNDNHAVGLPDYPFDYVPKESFRSLFYYHNFNPAEYDLILALNDKFFDKVLSSSGSTCRPNLTNKLILGEYTQKFGFDMIKTKNFHDDEIVFVKPIIGAGQHAFDHLCYKKFRYGDIKEEILSSSHHLVQSFVPSPLVTFVSVLINGAGDLAVMDISQAYHSFDYNNVSLNCHLESKSHQLESFTHEIELTKEFLKFTGFTAPGLPGIYMCQFTTDSDNFTIQDFNVRTGPISDYVTHHKLYTARVQNNFPFLLGDAPVKDTATYPNFRCYLTDKETGEILSPLVKDPDILNRRLLVENKCSGLIRNDYNTYLEIF